jgi:hypothetical protein
MKLAVRNQTFASCVNDIDVQSLDTIKALSKVRFRGIVTDNSNAAAISMLTFLPLFYSLIDKQRWIMMVWR